MSEITLNRTAEQIAAEINSIKEETKRVVIYNSIEIGRKLTEAKELVPAGEWCDWLDKSVDYKKSTANNLMRIFKEYGADQLSLIGSNTANELYDKLDYSKAVILLGTTEEEKEKILTENNVEDMSSRELKKVKEELARAKKEKEDAEKQNEELKNKSSEDLVKAREEIKKLENSNNFLKDEIAKTTEKLRGEADKKQNEAFRAKLEVKKFEKQTKELEEKIISLEAKNKELEGRTIEVVANDGEKEKLEQELKETRERTKEKILSLEKKKKELETQLNEKKETVEVDDAAIRYSIYFSDLVDTFDKLIGALEQIGNTEEQGNYREATNKLIEMMKSKI